MTERETRRDNIDRAQDRLDQAETELLEAENVFNAAAAEDAVVWSHNLEGLVKRVHKSVSRVRGRPSLDHNGTKQDVLKELDEILRRLPTLRTKIKILGENA